MVKEFKLSAVWLVFGSDNLNSRGACLRQRPRLPPARRVKREGATRQNPAKGKQRLFRKYAGIALLYIMRLKRSAFVKGKQAGALCRLALGPPLRCRRRLGSSRRSASNERTTSAPASRVSPRLKTPPPLTSSLTRKDRIIIAMLLLFVSLIFFDLLTKKKFGKGG